MQDFLQASMSTITALYYSSSRTLAQPALTASIQLSSLSKPFLSTASHGIFFMHSISGQHYLCKHSRSTLGVTLDPSFPAMSHLRPVATHCSITTVLPSPSPLSCSGLYPFSPGPFLVLCPYYSNVLPGFSCQSSRLAHFLIHTSIQRQYTDLQNISLSLPLSQLSFLKQAVLWHT